jgi:hypothetical protein
MSRLSLVFALAAVLVSALPASAAPPRQVPQGWVGVVADEAPFVNRPAIVGPEAREMSRAGIESVRSAFHWSVAQPYASWKDVPPPERREFVAVAGRPYDFHRWDQLVSATAARRLRLLPVVVGAPAWASDDDEKHDHVGALRPRSPALFSAFLRVLVGRYGPRGTFWKLHPGLPRVPVRTWQIWNEPNHEYSWAGKKSGEPPWPKTFTRLLAASYRTLKAADGGARVVLGGLNTWSEVQSLYLAGAKPWFDVMAIHPYTLYPRDVVEIVRYTREVMTRYGDARKPIVVTEMGWPAARHRAQPKWCRFCVTESRQARYASELLRRMAAARRELGINGVYWYSWISYYQGKKNPWEYSGLRSLGSGLPRSKPVLVAYSRIARRLAGRH